MTNCTSYKINGSNIIFAKFEPYVHISSRAQLARFFGPHFLNPVVLFHSTINCLFSFLRSSHRTPTAMEMEDNGGKTKSNMCHVELRYTPTCFVDLCCRIKGVQPKLVPPAKLHCYIIWTNPSSLYPVTNNF